MIAARYETAGGPDVLEVGEMPTPEPAEGEVRVRVALSGINPTDWKGRRRTEVGFPFQIPHHDAVGVIDAVGPAVDPVRVGERVWTWDAAYRRQWGTAAEFSVLPDAQAVSLSDDVPSELAVCLGIPARTAHRAVFADGPVEGQTLLVAGGAGAVGFYAIQLARFGGATVITTISSDDKAAIAQTSGADHVLNYRQDDVAAEVAEITSGKGVDRVVEIAFAANLELDRRILKPNGTIATFAIDEETATIPVPWLLLGNVTLRWLLVFTVPDEAKRGAIADINRALIVGALKPLPLIRFRLRDVRAAHQAGEQGAVGKIVLEIP